MDSSSEELFNDFYIKLTVLNYKYRSKIQLNDAEKNSLNYLKIIIPIFNKLIDKDDLTIEDVKNFSNFSNIGNTDATKEQHTDYLFVDTDTNKEQKPTISDSDDDEPDPEGDKQVEELTEKSLRQLEIIKNKRWIMIELEDEQDDGEVDDSSTSDTSSREYVSEDDTIPNEVFVPVFVDI